MYTTFFDLNDKPFPLTSDPQVFYTNPTSQRVYTMLLSALREHQDLIVFTGEVGTGKTTLLRRTMQHLGESIHFLFFSYTTLPFDDIVLFLCQELQAPVEETTPRHQKLIAINDILRARARVGRHTVLIIDEAQNLGEETLTALVSLCLGSTLTEPLLPLILAGQPEFSALFRRASLRPIAQRVTLHCRLGRLSNDDVAPYILHRLRAVGHEHQDLFTPQAVRRIALHATGIPRKIHLLCDNALHLAYKDKQKTVSAEMIDEVAEDFFPARTIDTPEVTPVLADPTTPRDDLATVRESPARGRSTLGEDRIHTQRQTLSSRIRAYLPPQVNWIGGGLALALPLLFLFLRPTPDMRQLSAVARTPQQAPMLPPATSQSQPEVSSPAPILPAPETPPSTLIVQSQPAPHEHVETVLPPQEIAKLETAPSLAASPQPALETREEPQPPTQKPTAPDPALLALRARAEQHIASLHQATEAVTSELARGNNGVNEGIARPQRPAKSDRRATLLLARAQQHTKDLSQAISLLEQNMADHAPDASLRLASLLKQTPQHETKLQQTVARLQAAALQQAQEQLQQAQLQEEVLQPVAGEPPADQQQEQSKVALAQPQPAGTRSEGTGERTLQHDSATVPSQSTPKTNGPDDNALILATLRGDTGTVGRLIAQGTAINASNRAGGTALMTAAIQGHSEVVNLLMKNGAAVNAKNNKGWTALMYAAWNGHTDIVNTLLAKGAAVNAQNNEGWTALMYATWKGQREAVRALLAGRAAVSMPSQTGESALTLAAQRSYADITTLLNGAGKKP